jgi:ribonuclease HII
MQGMHECIRETLIKLKEKTGESILQKSMAVIDGNYFTPYRWFDEASQTMQEFPFVTVEKGDGKYMGIAAASILAKDARDEYVVKLCEENPVLSEKYGLHTNMGYGTKTHLDGIREHGITKWHRRTFGEICRNATMNL